MGSDCNGKKNPYRFTIGFNKEKPSHQKTADILNQAGDKAELIASAVLYYMGEDNNNTASEMDFRNLQPFIQELVKQEMQKLVGGTGYIQKQEEPEVMDLTLEEEIPVDAELAEDLFSAMDAFRKT